MYILDTDHLTILQRGGQLAQQLKYKLADYLKYAIILKTKFDIVNHEIIN